MPKVSRQYNRNAKQSYNKFSKESQKARNEHPGAGARKVNHWIKTTMLENASIKMGTIHVLDAGSGKGGDIFKFFHNWGVKTYTGVDISDKSVEVARSRVPDYKKKTFSMHVGDLRTMTTLPGDEQFSIVSAQFMLHYLCETPDILGTFLKNIASRMDKGARFVGTTVNSEELENRIQTHGSTFGNSLYQIKSVDDHSYTFSMGDRVNECVEFVCKKDDVAREAKKYGLELEWWTPFSEYIANNMNELYHKMVQCGVNVENRDLITLYSAFSFVKTV